MEFGRIQRDAAPITLTEWDAILAAHDFLEQCPDRTMTNPFTKEKIAVSGRGKAYYMVQAKKSATRRSKMARS